MTFPVSQNTSKEEKKDETVLLESVNIESQSIERRPSNHHVKFFIKFICPLVALFVLCINTYSGPGLRITFNSPWSRARRIMRQYEASYGPFIREYFYEGKYDLYLPVYRPLDRVDISAPLPAPPIPPHDSCVAASNLRFDCFPRGPVSESECVERGCCYQLSSGPIPSCFYPEGYSSYRYSNITVLSNRVDAELTANFLSPYRNQIVQLHLMVQFLTSNTLTLAFSNSKSGDNGSPHFTSRRNAFERKFDTDDDRLYSFVISANSTGFQIVRKSNGAILFDTQNIGGLLFSEQFGQISTKLPSAYIYGLETRANEFPLNLNWNTITIFNHDTPPNKSNGYGSYPSYLCLEGDGKAHLVDFMVPTATDFRLQPGALTIRTLNSEFLISITIGDTPAEVYKHRIFRPPLPPFWALGSHFSRFGMKNTSHVKDTWSRIKNAKIPLDTLWSDIDYMDNRNDFTLSPEYVDLPQFVNELHKEGMHYVIITDPGISGSEKPGKYPPYDRGIKLDVFVKDSEGHNPLVGKVWNEKSTVFPDFSHSEALSYWMGLIDDFHKKVEFDGIWLDMNEPSNFVDGSITGCSNNSLEHPPYLPEVDGGILNYHTLCMSALHYRKIPHYIVHNSYSLFETAITHFALAEVREKRAFIITRSGSYATNMFAGIWTGDVYSTWDDLKQSVRDVLTFNLLGQPLVGADICGFNGNTTVNLCRRWHQLGAFYPFSRNHNSDDAIDQDPVALGIQDDVRPAIIKRYALLPYLYTQFFLSSEAGYPVVRPTFYAFPQQVETYTIDTQFFWGDAVLIVPAMEESVSYVKAYIGSGVWYNFDTFGRLQVEGTQVVLPALQNDIPILLRGGYVVPMFNVNGSVTTQQLRDAGSLNLIVALNETEEATGMLYWDDGDSISAPFSFGHFFASKGKFSSRVYSTAYKDNLRIDAINVFTLKEVVTNVTINSKNCPFSYNQSTMVLTIEPKLSAFLNFTVVWS